MPAFNAPSIDLSAPDSLLHLCICPPPTEAAGRPAAHHAGASAQSLAEITTSTLRTLLRLSRPATLQTGAGHTHGAGVGLMATTITRSHVSWKGRRFDLSSALTFTLELDDDMWCYDCPSLGLLGCGPSREAAIARFESEFAFLWDEIACESDDALLPQAQELKRRLTRLVSSVREAA